MKITRLQRAIALAVLTLPVFAAPAARAQDTGFYVGGAFGPVEFRNWCRTTTTVLLSCDDETNAWKIFGGYWFSRYLGVEATYVDWGKVSGTIQVGTQVRDVSAEQTSMGLAAIGRVPITREVSVFGKLGRLWTEQEVRSVAPTSSSTGEAKDQEWHYGIGLTYALSRNFGLRGEWENTEKLKARMLSIGLEYNLAPVLVPSSLTYTGLYVGGSLGQMKADGDCRSGFSCDFEDTGWKIFGGYRAHRNVAVEVTYGSWGDIALSTQSGSTTVTATGSISSWGVAVLGLVPARERFSLFGKAGVLITEQEIAASGAGITRTEINDGGEFHWGGGAIFSVTTQLGLRAEWERLHKSDVDFLSLGVQYSF